MVRPYSTEYSAPRISNTSETKGIKCPNELRVSVPQMTVRLTSAPNPSGQRRANLTRARGSGPSRTHGGGGDGQRGCRPVRPRPSPLASSLAPANKTGLPFLSLPTTDEGQVLACRLGARPGHADQGQGRAAPGMQTSQAQPDFPGSRLPTLGTCRTLRLGPVDVFPKPGFQRPLQAAARTWGKEVHTEGSRAHRKALRKRGAPPAARRQTQATSSRSLPSVPLHAPVNAFQSLPSFCSLGQNLRWRSANQGKKSNAS